MVRALLVKKYRIRLLTNVWYILLVLCSLLHLFHFPFNLRLTKTIENIYVWKQTETGSGAGAMKKRAPEPELQLWKLTTPELEPEPLSWTEELRSRAVSFLRQLRSPVLVKAYSWS